VVVSPEKDESSFGSFPSLVVKMQFFGFFMAEKGHPYE
jgi:hypothetical protein